MTLRDGFDRTVSDWLDEQAGRGAPDYLQEVLARTTRIRQRPAWSSLERWLPVAITYRIRLAPVRQVAWALAVLAALVVAVALLVLAGAGRPRLPMFGAQANGTFAFVDGDSLKFASADGTAITSRLSMPTGASAIAWSPDGTQLVYRTDESAPSIVVLSADGKRSVTVASGVGVADGDPIAWAPDSRRLAFTGMANGLGNITIVNADGTGLQVLDQASSIAPVERFDPAWSPDGGWIAFFSPEANGYVGLYLVHPDGTGMQRLQVSPPNPDILDMSWAPDPTENRLAYVTGGYVKLLDVATSTETTVGDGFWPRWSPDATRIAWWGRGGTQVSHIDDIVALGARTVHPFPTLSGGLCGDQPEVAGKAICSPAHWSPDGLWVYGVDVLGASIVIGRADGSGQIRTIPLDHHPVDLGEGSGPQLSWQAVAP